MSQEQFSLLMTELADAAGISWQGREDHDAATLRFGGVDVEFLHYAACEETVISARVRRLGNPDGSHPLCLLALLRNADGGAVFGIDAEDWLVLRRQLSVRGMGAAEFEGEVLSLVTEAGNWRETLDSSAVWRAIEEYAAPAPVRADSPPAAETIIRA